MIPIKQKSKSKNYFTQETEDAIIEYNKSDDANFRSRIYGEKIHYAFFKLTQNIIHTFKFYQTEVENLEDVQQELIIFLLTKIHLFNHRKNIQDRVARIIKKEFPDEIYDGDFFEFVGEVDRVTQSQINNFIDSLNISSECKDVLKSKLTPPKAYSYFGTISKRWLILENQNIYKKKLRHVVANENIDDEKYFDEYDENFGKLEEFFELFIKYVDENLEKLFPISKNGYNMEAQIAEAILNIFKQLDYIDIFNKKAFNINIKEKIIDYNIKTSRIALVIKKFEKIFFRNYSFFLENGYTNF